MLQDDTNLTVSEILFDVCPNRNGGWDNMYKAVVWIHLAQDSSDCFIYLFIYLWFIDSSVKYP
jgi:hypothetical protein